MRIRIPLALLLIFLAVLAFRLYFAFQTPNFNYDAYFNVRQTTHIVEHDLPAFNDPVSYSGRNLVFLPLFHYILALASTLLPLTLVLKILPNLFASLTVFVVYLVAYDLTKRKDAAFFAAFISAFLPIFISGTLNTVSEYSLMIPLTFLLFYFIMKVENRKFLKAFIIAIVIATFLHSSVLLLVFSLLLYLVFLKVENINLDRAETELILFSTILVLWLTTLFFKNALLVHGPAVVWQNMPAQLLGQYFKNLNILEAIYKIGVIPFLAGIFVIYRYVFVEKLKTIYLFISFSLTALLLLWFRLVQLNAGLMFLGMALALLFAQFYTLALEYISKTKFSKLKPLFITALVVLLITTSIFPSINYAKQSINNVPSQQEIEALLWLKNNTRQDEIILSTLDEGHLITAVAERKNVMDTNFLLIQNTKQRLKDLNELYTTPHTTNAVNLLTKYSVDYIFYSINALKSYGKKPIYLDNKDCFALVYENTEAQVYETKCVMT